MTCKVSWKPLVKLPKFQIIWSLEKWNSLLLMEWHTCHRSRICARLVPHSRQLRDRPLLVVCVNKENSASVSRTQSYLKETHWPRKYQTHDPTWHKVLIRRTNLWPTLFQTKRWKFINNSQTTTFSASCRQDHNNHQVHLILSTRQVNSGERS